MLLTICFIDNIGIKLNHKINDKYQIDINPIQNEIFLNQDICI